MLSKVQATATLRFDSEYYKKIYLQDSDFITKSSNNFTTIKKLKLSVDASAFYPALEAYYNTGTIPFIRVADVKDQIDYLGCVKIPSMGNTFRTLHLCHRGDVVLTKGGRVGTAGLITRDSYVTRDLIFINSSTLKRKDYISLYLYFCTGFAQRQMLRSSSMTAQPHLTVTLIQDLCIWKFSDKFKSKLENVYNNYESIEFASKRQYSDAQDILAKVIQWEDNIGTGNYAIKSLSESFGASGRLDAEYYQPKYEAIAKKMNKMRSGLPGNGCKILDANYTPIPNKKYKYIELSNIGSSGEITGCTIEAGGNLPTRARRIVHTGDVIVSSIEGSLQSCALVTEEYNNALCSNGFYVLASDKVSSEALLVLFKSEPIQALLKQQCSGTILTAFSKEGLQSIPLPDIDDAVQQAVTEKVQCSFALRKQAKKLFAAVARAVEIAIEDGEEAAIEYLDGVTSGKD